MMFCQNGGVAEWQVMPMEWCSWYNRLHNSGCSVPDSSGLWQEVTKVTKQHPATMRGSIYNSKCSVCHKVLLSSL